MKKLTLVLGVISLFSCQSKVEKIQTKINEKKSQIELVKQEVAEADSIRSSMIYTSLKQGAAWTDSLIKLGALTEDGIKFLKKYPGFYNGMGTIEAVSLNPFLKNQDSIFNSRKYKDLLYIINSGKSVIDSLEKELSTLNTTLIYAKVEEK